MRGSPAIGRIASGSGVTPLCPPQLTTLRNPICPWDASTRWHRAFAPDSLTLRSNAPQLRHLGMPAAPPSPDTDRDMCLVPAVTGGALRFLVRPRSEVPGARGLMGSSDSSLLRLRSPSLIAPSAPSYLSYTPRLPALPSSSRASSPAGYDNPHRIFMPAHLKKNGVFESKTFEARRMGRPQVWKTSAQEMSESVHGLRAYE